MIAAILDNVDGWAVWLAAVVGGMLALGKLFQLARRATRWAVALGRKIDRLDELASYELQQNGGGSIKDAAAMIPPLKAQLDAHIAASEDALRQGSRDRERIDDTLQTLTDHQVIIAEAQAEQQSVIADLARALPIVARSTPADADSHT
jgi:purine nucleoside permease